MPQSKQNMLAIFSTITKTAPGGDLIRVDLIRFPGSIPGDEKMCTDKHHLLSTVSRSKYTKFKIVLGTYS